VRIEERNQQTPLYTSTNTVFDEQDEVLENLLQLLPPGTRLTTTRPLDGFNELAQHPNVHTFLTHLRYLPLPLHTAQDALHRWLRRIQYELDYLHANNLLPSPPSSNTPIPTWDPHGHILDAIVACAGSHLRLPTAVPSTVLSILQGTPSLGQLLQDNPLPTLLDPQLQQWCTMLQETLGRPFTSFQPIPDSSSDDDAPTPLATTRCLANTYRKSPAVAHIKPRNLGPLKNRSLMHSSTPVATPDSVTPHRTHDLPILSTNPLSIVPLPEMN